MKATVFERVQTTVELQSDFSDRIIPLGVQGTIIECYEQPEEGYAVDLAIPDENLVGGFAYENVILKPDQFVILKQS